MLSCDFVVPEGQTMYTKQKCHDGLKGACFELVNAAGQAEVNMTMISCESFLLVLFQPTQVLYV